jgi:hypothetical protein
MSFQFKCESADKYKAKLSPKCNGGDGCVICNRKWEKANASGKGQGSKRRLRKTAHLG